MKGQSNYYQLGMLIFGIGAAIFLPMRHRTVNAILVESRTIMLKTVVETRTIYPIVVWIIQN